MSRLRLIERLPAFLHVGGHQSLFVRSMKFTERLRSASRSAHGISDALVNARLVVLFTSRELYARALACFYFVFIALEDALSRSWERDQGAAWH